MAQRTAASTDRPRYRTIAGAGADVLELAGRAVEVVLGVQRAVQRGPAVVDLADAVPVGDADIAVVGDVGARVHHVGQRLAVESRGAERHQEEGQALVLGQGRVGPGEQEDMGGELGVGGEDLLPVDDPLVAVADRPGLGPGDVGPAVRLGVADADPGRSAGDPGLQLVADPRIPVGLDGGPDQLGEADHAHRRVPVTQLALEDLDAHVVQSRAAVFLPPARPQPALGAHGELKALIVGRVPLPHPRVHLGGELLVQERPDLIPERALRFGEGDG